ncbi:MAG: cation transporter [Gemmatimonadaceae bacterium]|nr:cation transporter [Gemmatimonadaceae bacterium]
MTTSRSREDAGVRATMLGLIINSILVVVKLVAGIVGTSGALVADGIESSADIFSSLIVWKGLRVAGRAADKDYHFGYGKAESVSAAVVSMMLLGAALAITINAIREIITPHHLPATFTLYVLAAVIAIKEYLYRRTLRIGREVGSVAVTTDAWHHRADAITSATAFIGIAIAIRGGPGWEQADDYAALIAALIIALNGMKLLRPAIEDLMDRAPSVDLLESVTNTAMTVPEVRAIEKLRARKTGTGYLLDMHIESDPAMSLHDAHIVSGKVKSAIRREIPLVQGVLIHMEPHEPK